MQVFITGKIDKAKKPKMQTCIHRTLGSYSHIGTYTIVGAESQPYKQNYSKLGRLRRCSNPGTGKGAGIHVLARQADTLASLLYTSNCTCPTSIKMALARNKISLFEVQ